MARAAKTRLLPILGWSMALWSTACTAPESGQTILPGGPSSQKPAVSFQHEPNVLHINVAGNHFGDYVYSNPEITRPFFAHVKTPAGIQVTRNHPPVPVEDLTDHATMHPGVWTSYGDINGNDYWRLKAKVEHEMFIQPPEGGEGKGTFAVRNYYRNREDTDRIGSEEVTYTILAEPEGYWLISDSSYAPHGETERLVFGDQEEFGLGIRVQTRIAEQFGGVISDSEGRRGARNIWSKQADWIDYSGMLKGKWIGMTVMPDPGNFRKPWYHARDYGLIVANAFGQEAMQAGPRNEVVVNRGEKLRLRYGLLIHSADSKESPDLSQAYRSFLSLIGP